MPSVVNQLSYDEATSDPVQMVEELRRAIAIGQPWFDALLAAVQRWRAPHEVIDGRHYYYLIGGEAFDWLLLAERLLDAVAELVPEEEREALLFAGKAPAPLVPETFKRAIGTAKYRAHLNFLYGVTVEQALQLAVEEDIHKELRCRAWGTDRRTDESLFHRIYLKGKAELLATFRDQRGLPHEEFISFSEAKEFTYWLFKYRLQQCDRAKVASDTRRGLTQLARLNALHDRGSTATAADVPDAVIDIALA
jgi:hypothetical protein